MDSAFIQKLVWTLLGIGTYALSAWPPLASVAELLKLAAGGMLTSPWVARPGDGKLIAAGKATRASIAPLACVLVLLGCAGAEKAVEDARAANTRAQAQAAVLRTKLSDARDLLSALGSSVTTLCAFQRVELCSTAEDSVRVLEAAHKAAAYSVDTLGVAAAAAPEVAQQVANVADQVEALGATVEALGKAVGDVVAQAKDPGAGGDGVGPVVQPAPESPAGAAPAGAEGVKP